MKITKLTILTSVIVNIFAIFFLSIWNKDFVLSFQVVAIPAIITVGLIYLSLRFKSKLGRKISINLTLISALIWTLIFVFNGHLLNGTSLIGWALYFWSLSAAIIFGFSQIIIYVLLLIHSSKEK